MAGAQFPSGPWVGFYNYVDPRISSSRRFMMDLNLRFHGGKIDGDGADGLDTFVIEGVYDAQTRVCTWRKIYPRTKAVAYQGYREGKGIWGTWTLPETKGGFHIWPLSEGGPPDLREMKEEEPLELARPIIAPAIKA